MASRPPDIADRISWKSSLEAYAYLLPAGVILAAFWCLPVVLSLLVSFTNWHGADTVGDVKWVGGENYAMALRDPRFFKTLANTVNYVLWSVPLTLALSLGSALLLTLKIRGIALFRTAFFLPYITTWVAISIVWSYFFQQNFGLANHFLEVVDAHLHLGIGPLKWLNEPRGVLEMVATGLAERLHLIRPGVLLESRALVDAVFAMAGWTPPQAVAESASLLAGGPSLSLFSIILTSVWRDSGYFMLIFLAGLQGIEPAYYEAAAIDGAGPLRRFRTITLPLLSPVSFFCLLIAVIGAFKVFVPMLIMTPGGGPGGATTTLVYFLYEEGFQSWRLGYASAIAYILFVIILAITVLQNRVLGRRVYYQ